MRREEGADQSSAPAPFGPLPEPYAGGLCCKPSLPTAQWKGPWDQPSSRKNQCVFDRAVGRVGARQHQRLFLKITCTVIVYARNHSTV